MDDHKQEGEQHRGLKKESAPADWYRGSDEGRSEKCTRAETGICGRLCVGDRGEDGRKKKEPRPELRDKAVSGESEDGQRIIR